MNDSIYKEVRGLRREQIKNRLDQQNIKYDEKMTISQLRELLVKNMVERKSVNRKRNNRDESRDVSTNKKEVKPDIKDSRDDSEAKRLLSRVRKTTQPPGFLK